MVAESPEPPIEIRRGMFFGNPEDIETIVISSDSEDEVQVNDLQGYNLLPQDPEGVLEASYPDESGSGSSTDSFSSSEEEENDNTITNNTIADCGRERPVVLGEIGEEASTSASPQILPVGTSEPLPGTSGVSGRGEEQYKSVQRNSFEMSEDHVEQVRAAMSNISLPPSSFPSWAREVPEEQWHRVLLEKIGHKK